METHIAENIYPLLKNDDFIQWLLHPTPDLDNYWSKVLRKENITEDNIILLRKILTGLRVKEPEFTYEDKALLWQKIKKESLDKQKKRNPIHYYIRIAAAIIGFIFLIGGVYYSINHYQKNKKIDYVSIVNRMGEKTPNQGNVRLIVSKDEEFEITEDNAELVYAENGDVNVNSEKIELQKSNSIENKPQFNQLIVPYGKSSSIILNDGTKIWINSGSKLIYPAVFDKNKREIFVEGEIYLEVAKNDKAPFIVKTESLEINVVGTSFNVQAYKGDINQSIVLVTGVVNVKNESLKTKVQMKPNQMYSYEPNSKNAFVENVDIYDYICWKYGFLHFQSERLSTVLKSLERHYDINLNYDEAQTQKIKVSGKLDLKESIKDVFESIAVTAPISYQLNESGIKIDVKP